MKRKKDGGFTLIELMIVIAVIGILAVVLVPKVGAVKTSAKITGIDVNVRTVQGYIQSRITTWGDDTTTFTQAKIAADIASAFNDSTVTDPLKNPFATSGGTTISNKLASTPDTLATDTSDALQIVGLAADATGKGAIAVVVPSTALSSSNGITIIGLNKNATLYSSVTVKP